MSRGKRTNIDLKRSLVDLQIVGGAPAYIKPLHVGAPNIGSRKRLLERINAILDRNYLTNNGPCVEELESKVREITQVHHCIALANCTSALEIAIRASSLSGDVLLPSFTFVATAHAVRWLGLQPVFCDVKPDSHHLDPADVEARITERTSAIIGVHTWGEPADIDHLTSIADKYRLKLLFDAAHAFGSAYKGKPIGGFGVAEVFSFHATKYINSLEGGFITTNDPVLAETARLMRNFGFAGRDQSIMVGTNAKMSEFSAAMGLTNLESRELFVKRNRRLVKTYSRHLAGVAGVNLRFPKDVSTSNCQYIVAEIDGQSFGATRDTLLKILHSEGVLARRYFYPGCHRMAAYANCLHADKSTLPHTDALCEKVLLLPTGMGVNVDDVAKICSIICVVKANATELQRLVSEGR